MKSKVVILGAGFGGTYVAKRLSKLAKSDDIDLTIVSKNNFFLFTPLLHEVATGSLSPTSVTESIREIFRKCNITFHEGEVESIDRERKIVKVTNEHRTHEVKYDILVLATGAETNFYGIPGAAENTYPLKSLRQALDIRSAVIDNFERASTEADEEFRKQLLTFVVVGGGPTGVETAAELSEFTREITKHYYLQCPSEYVRICLINNQAELLTQFDTKLRKWALQRLTDMGVEVFLNKNVTKVDRDKIYLDSDLVINTNTVIWAAGVRANPLNFIGSMPENISGRLVTDQYLRLKDDPTVYVLGDLACFPKVPMLAQAAVVEAKSVAQNILAAVTNKKQRIFRFRLKGDLVSLGQWYAIGIIYGIPIKGRLTWWLWRCVYLFKFASWRKRLKIATEWFVGMFFARDLTKIG